MKAPALARVAAFAALSCLAACAPVRGFPDDPADQSDFSSFVSPAGNPVQIYGPASEAAYDSASDDLARTAARNQIIRHRLWGYDRTYSSFKRRLTLDGNIVSAGGSLAALVLGGLAATTGNTGTSNALAAAGAGIIGAQGVINRELYFQKTLPALMAQRDAARDQALAPILAGMKLPDSRYSLTDANADLQRLKDAGSIEGAINTINQDAAIAKQDAQAAITRTTEYGILTIEPREAVGRVLLDIKGPQAVALANAMVTHLDTASPEGQAAARRILPPTGRFAPNQSNRARQFLREWADAETMTPARARIWNDEIKRAANQGG